MKESTEEVDLLTLIGEDREAAIAGLRDGQKPDSILEGIWHRPLTSIWNAPVSR